MAKFENINSDFLQDITAPVDSSKTPFSKIVSFLDPCMTIDKNKIIIYFNKLFLKYNFNAIDKESFLDLFNKSTSDQMYNYLTSNLIFEIEILENENKVLYKEGSFLDLFSENSFFKTYFLYEDQNRSFLDLFNTKIHFRMYDKDDQENKIFSIEESFGSILDTIKNNFYFKESFLDTYSIDINNAENINERFNIIYLSDFSFLKNFSTSYPLSIQSKDNYAFYINKKINILKDYFGDKSNVFLEEKVSNFITNFDAIYCADYSFQDFIDLKIVGINRSFSDESSINVLYDNNKKKYIDPKKILLTYNENLMNFKKYINTFTNLKGSFKDPKIIKEEIFKDKKYITSFYIFIIKTIGSFIDPSSESILDSKKEKIIYFLSTDVI